MGKGADNERIKLNATRNNNVSVGLALVGVFVPYLAFVQNWPPVPDHPSLFHYLLDDIQVRFKVLAIVIALACSRFFRIKALKEIAKLQD